MFNLPEDGNYRDIINDYDSFTSNDCENYGCDSICRCRTIESVTVSNSMENCFAFFKQTYDGSSDHLEQSLAFWFLRLHFKNFEWEPIVGGGYYGQELDGIKLSFSSGFYEQGALFIKLSTTEKIHYLLTKEYGKVLPEVAAVKKWICEPVFIDDVRNSDNTDLSKAALDEYMKLFESVIRSDQLRSSFQEHVLPFAPLCLNVGHRTFRVVDGRHRCRAFQTTYIYSAQGKKGWTEKEFIPIFMWVIHPDPNESKS